METETLTPALIAATVAADPHGLTWADRERIAAHGLDEGERAHLWLLVGDDADAVADELRRLCRERVAS